MIEFKLLALSLGALLALGISVNARPLPQELELTGVQIESNALIAAVDSNVTKAQQLASTLSNTRGLPENVSLRFKILANLIPSLTNSKENPNDILSFFGTTRQLALAQPLSPTTSATLGQLEQQVALLAKRRNINLAYLTTNSSQQNAMPSKATKTVGKRGVTSAAISSTANLEPSSSMLGSSLSASELLRLGEAVQREIKKATSNSTAILLLGLDDSITVLNKELQKAPLSLPAPRVRDVLLTRARLLASSSGPRLSPNLKSSLDVLAQGLQATFTPQALRAAGSGSVYFP